MELVLVRMMVITMALIITIIMPLYSVVVAKVDVGHIRQLAAKNNVSCILVFGDSSVDPGNNNVLGTTMKSNFPPYGKDFFNSRPTGRFSNGRLATDFIADEAVGFRKIVPPFLDPNLKLEDLPYGVSFASAATGYDDLTANISNVLPVSKQIEYLKHYKIHMRKLLGEERAEFIIRNALYVVSMGTNDFLQNYFLEDTRQKQFSLHKFEDFLLSQMSKDIEIKGEGKGGDGADEERRRAATVEPEQRERRFEGERKRWRRRRARRGRKKEKKEKEEVLVIEGIEFERSVPVKFDAFINDEDDKAVGPNNTEFAGSFVSVPHSHKHKNKKMKTVLRLGLTDLLEDLGAEDDDSVMVTLVPRYGKGKVQIRGIKIEFIAE